MEKRIQFRQRESKRTELENQFWPRAFAFTIDLMVLQLIIPVVFSLLALVAPTDLSDELARDYSSVTTTTTLVVVVPLLVLYGAVLESSRLRGTAGKWFLRFAVCDTDIDQLSFPKALIRNTLKILSVISVVGVFMIDMTSRRQALHDLIARTIVVRR